MIIERLDLEPLFALCQIYSDVRAHLKDKDRDNVADICKVMLLAKPKATRAVVSLSTKGCVQRVF